jgi:hypothetical protein
MSTVSTTHSKGWHLCTHWVLELGVDFRDNLPHLLQLGKHVFLLSSTSEHRLHLA